MKELQPINQHVLLEMEAKEEKTTSGIIIPDTVNEKHQFAKVLAISGIEDPEISVGDVVFYKNFSGTELEFNGNGLSSGIYLVKMVANNYQKTLKISLLK